MHAIVLDRLPEITEACRKFGVKRLSIFGSAARGVDFDIAKSDADLLVEFTAWTQHDPYPDLKDELTKIFGRKIDLLDKEALDESQNHVRQSAILKDAELLYGS